MNSNGPLGDATISDLLSELKAAATKVVHDAIDALSVLLGTGDDLRPAECEICRDTILVPAVGKFWWVCQTCGVRLGWDGVTPTVSATFNVVGAAR